jgi:hypothetical protein
MGAANQAPAPAQQFAPPGIGAPGVPGPGGAAGAAAPQPANPGAKPVIPPNAQQGVIQ